MDPKGGSAAVYLGGVPENIGHEESNGIIYEN
jgi:hypothetical protein